MDVQEEQYSERQRKPDAERRNQHRISSKSLDGVGGRCRPSLVCVACFGATALVAAVAVGLALQVGFDLNAGASPATSELTPCALDRLGFDPALGIQVDNVASPQWSFGVAAVGTFIERRYFLTAMAAKFYRHLPASKQVKVANSLLQLLNTTAVLLLSIRNGFFQLLFSPDDFAHPDADQAFRLVSGTHLIYIILMTMYLTELALDPELGVSSAVHCWISIILCIWGVWAVNLVKHDHTVSRCFFAHTLYMCTQQNVFVEILLYHKKVFLPRLFYASAAYYLVSRAIIGAMCLIIWRGMFAAVFERDLADSFVVYSLWVFIPAANVILNVTQFATGRILLGIAASVRRRCSEDGRKRRLSKHVGAAGGADAPPPMPIVVHAASNESPVASDGHTSWTTALDLLRTQARCGLMDAFGEIDFEHRGAIDERAWARYVQEAWGEEALLPRSAFFALFDEMAELSEDGAAVTAETFEAFFGAYMVGEVDFALVVRALVTQRACARNDLDPSLRKLLEQSHEETRQRVVRQCAKSVASMGGDAPNSELQSDEVAQMEAGCADDDDEEARDVVHALQTRLALDWRPPRKRTSSMVTEHPEELAAVASEPEPLSRSWPWRWAARGLRPKWLSTGQVPVALQGAKEDGGWTVAVPDLAPPSFPGAVPHSFMAR